MFVNIVTLTSVVLLINRVRSSVPYSIPEPKIEIFKKGFRFSIPNDDGVELFAFHGNVNVPMHGVEAGYFSIDIVKKCGDFWVFEDKTKSLFVGDTIYFWLFVIKNRLGYRYDDGHFIVKEISQYSPLTCPTPPTRKDPADVWTYDQESTSEFTPIAMDVRHTRPPAPKSEEKEQEEDIQVCCDLFLNVSYRIIAVAEENQKLIEENKVLYELAQKDDHHARTLKIFGKYPTEYYPTPKDFAQTLIKGKLLLDDVKVTEGARIADGISFKVATVRDKVNIILAAKKGLKGSIYELSW